MKEVYFIQGKVTEKRMQISCKVYELQLAQVPLMTRLACSIIKFTGSSMVGIF